MPSNYPRVASWGLVLIVAAAGCRSFGRDDDAIGSYEEMRREVEGAAPGDVSLASSDSVDPDAGFQLADLKPAKVKEKVKILTGRGPNERLAHQLFESAQREFDAAVSIREQEGDARSGFAEAAGQFHQAADRWPNSTLEHDALFLEGEAHFFADNYPDAEDAFERLLKKYPNSRHLDRIQPRRFEIARYWLSLDETDPQKIHEVNLQDKSRPWRDMFGHAIRVLDRIRLDDPTGRLADDATLAMGNAFFTRGKYMRADEYYTDLRRTFPNSEHQFAAHFLGLKAKLLSYQGPDYSANALNEAEKLVKQIRRQFPLESEREADYIQTAHLEIRFRLAEREWTLARHYDQRSAFGAARMYYQTILDEYADTPFAERAQARLGDIHDFPASPPERLTWLKKIFPEEETVKPILNADATLR